MYGNGWSIKAYGGDLLAGLAVICCFINWCVIDQCGSPSGQSVPTDVVSVGV